MFVQNDLGASLFKTWNDKQRRDEIEKLVQGYRSGLPVGILCTMAETIAGSRKRARKHLHALLSDEERKNAIARESGGMMLIVKEFLG